jgi:hypothetical protein
MTFEGLARQIMTTCKMQSFRDLQIFRERSWASSQVGLLPNGFSH